MFSFLSKILDSNEKQVNKLRPLVERINDLEKTYEAFSDDQIKAKTKEFRELLTLNVERSTLDTLLPDAFALVREAAKRTLKMRHFDVQLLAGMVLHQGKIAEQKTGEGKTLTATLPLYLNSLTGLGCHLVTPNDYLSRHGAGWMGPVYNLLAVSVGVLIHEQAFLFDPEFTNESFMDEYSKRLRPVSRHEAYAADITYGTNNEFGFDYLRDNMVGRADEVSQINARGEIGSHFFAIVDEVDSILIDEARTPLIISAPAQESTERYYDFAKLTQRLTPKTDYLLDEKHKACHLTELGITKIENWLGVTNLYEKDFQTVHHIEQALKAQTLFQKDRDYVVKEGEVIIVDEFTGRLMPGRRFSDGLHQALEAKEGVTIQRESKTLATVSFQNYFRLYKKLSGMTGTAVTEAEEFFKIYHLDVVVIPTHNLMIRKDRPDVVYKTVSAKYRAVVSEIEDCYKRGQPVLVGTTSIEKNELLHSLLEHKNIPHQVLNAKQHEREALIISQSGQRGAVTLATNMAGRGVDIILGGDASSKSQMVDDWKKEHDDVVKLGGLHVIGTERHESRRIDNQLRGRSGRQGDPGSSKFFVSLQDDLMRIFGGEMVEKMMDRLGIDEGIPIENPLVSRSIEQSQKKVEGYNFDTRKHLVEYDDVMNKQREVIYLLRRRILEWSPESQNWFLEKISSLTRRVEKTSDLTDSDSTGDPEFSLTGLRPKQAFLEAQKKFGADWENFVKHMSLQVVDTLWTEHLDNMEDLREGIGLRGYGGIEPLVEYKREAHILFGRLIDEIYGSIGDRILEAVGQPSVNVVVEKGPSQISNLVYRHDSPAQAGNSVGRPPESDSLPIVNKNKVGRNDPCPCGAKKADGTPVKYKHCHGKNL